MLTGHDPELVPDFVNLDPRYWLADTGEWLSWRGFGLVALVPVQEDAPLDVSALATPIGPHIEVGLTPSGDYHAVVKDGDELRDPAGGEGLAETLGMYWVVPIG